MNDELIGNLSTIMKFFFMTLAGYLIGVAAANGLDLPIDQTALAELLSTLFLFILAYIDAKHPNTFPFLGNAKAVLVYDNEEKVLNDEYVTTEEEQI